MIRTSFALVISAAALAAHADPIPADGAALKGVYGGSYVCQDGEHGFYLDLANVTPKDGGGFEASGVLGFFPTLAGASGQLASVAGSFAVAGTIAADGALSMSPGDWLKEPAGYGAAALDAKIAVREDGAWAITGKPVVPGNEEFCSALTATRFLP